MKTFTFTTLKFICLLAVLFVTNSCNRFVKMHEVENNLQVQNQAPAESVAVFREFFAYVQKAEPSIVTDESAQNRWLTQRMRKALINHIKRSGSPTGNLDYPSNATFTGCGISLQLILLLAHGTTIIATMIIQMIIEL